MIKSMFSGVAGLRAHQSKMNVIGNNIANVNTPSFKAGIATFRDSFYQTMNPASASGGGFGGGNPNQVGYGSDMSSVDVLHTPSSFSPTDNPMDAMIEGNGYFMVGTKDGTQKTPKDLNLTRVGKFNIDGDGYLVDSNKNYVYGYSATFQVKRDADSTVTPPVTERPAGYYMPPIAAGTPPTLGPIKVPPAWDVDTTTGEITENPTGKNMELADVSIGSDGVISGVFNERAVVVGQIAVANVPNPNALQALGGSYYRAGANTGEVTQNVPGAGSTGSVRSGGLEMPNVDLAKEFSDMITTQRGFQANTRIITVSDEMLQELVNLKR